MALTALLSLHSLRSLSAQTLNFLRATRSIFPSHPLTPGYFSSLSSLQATSTTDSSDPKHSSLSARMSFVFDQIDAIERERSEKDDTLQRIRAWRESKKTKSEENAFGLKPSEWNSVGTKSGESEVKEEERGPGLVDRKVEVVHPWREWIELMERLVHQNYFDHMRKDEDKMVEDLGFKLEEVAEDVGFDFTRDWKTVQTACLNFGRDRFDILRSLSRQDIQILVGYGCPSADKKVIFSAKLLRKHVHLDEGDVCSSCNLRSSCERAYLVTNKEDEARTIDIMRILLTYGFNPINGSVVNDSLLKLKSVKTVVRKLLHEVVKLSAIPIDPNLPPPIIRKAPPKVKQPPPPPKKRVGRDDIEMKMGDWLCPKCDFMNFAKNTVCLQCDAKRPKRQLLPGEWECPQCDFLNYRRNMVCFQCEHNRPPDEFTENQLQDRKQSPRTRRPENVPPSRSEISNAWNFDFDDNESDGADVSAFEYADSPLHAQSRGENIKGLDDDSYKPTRTSREYYDRGQQKTRKGFVDDFDNEEDDSVESFELDTQNSSQVHKISSIDFSEIEGDSESEDVEGFDDGDRIARERNRPSKTIPRKLNASSCSDEEIDERDYVSDDALPVDPNWKSNHFFDYSRRRRTRGSSGTVNFADRGIGSDSDDLETSNFRSQQQYKADRCCSSSRPHSRRRQQQLRDSDNEAFSDSDVEDRYPTRNRFGGTKKDTDNKRGNNSRDHVNFSESERKDRYSTRNRFGGTKKDTDNKRGDNSRDRDNYKLSGNPRFGSNGFNGSSQNRGFEWRDGVNKSSQGSHGNNKGFRRDG